MMRSEAVSHIRLSMTQGLKRASKSRILECFPDIRELFRQSAASLKELGLSEKETECLLSSRNVPEAEESLEILLKCGGIIIPYMSAQYPRRLKQTADPPVALYCLGEIPDVDALPVIAMVGTRKCDEEGSRAARKIAREISSLGGIVCTGLADGIDRRSAEGALSAGGRVIGVLGTAIDKVYPAENAELYDAVREAGCILSEYPPLYGIGKKGFPARNRIIAGLSLGVVVVQAPEKSGALITAEHAASEGRDVFVVPGSIGDGLSQGSNSLLKDGAMVVQSGEDVMQSYVSRTDLSFVPPPEKTQPENRYAVPPPDRPSPVRRANKKPSAPQEAEKQALSEEEESEAMKELLSSLTEDQLKIVSALSGQEQHIDNIILATGLSASRALSELTLLQLKGVVVQTPGKRFSLNILKRR